MTLDEAIERELYRVEVNRDMANSFHTDENIYSKEEEAFRNREDYHSQIAEWLRELKALREGLRDVVIIPSGHGRLIDADELYERSRLCHTEEDGTACVEWREINNAPTIIEADKEVNADDT